MLTSQDIESKEFNKSLKGYSQEEVDNFLDEVLDTMEELNKENDELKGDLAEISSKYYSSHNELLALKKSYEQLGLKYLELENSLGSTLDAAKSIMNDLTSSAERRANVIIQNAQYDAENIVKSARENVSKLMEQEEFLRNRVQTVKLRFKYLLEAEVKTLEQLDQDVLGEKVRDEFDNMLDDIKGKK